MRSVIGKSFSAGGNTTMGTTEEIASFLAATRVDDIPGEVLALAKRGVIDTLGVAIGAASHPVADILTKTFPPATAGDVSLWSGRGKASTLDAALSNGTLAHTLDFDDGGVALTPMHPSTPVLAAVWSLAESLGLSGREDSRCLCAGSGSRVQARQRSLAHPL